MSAELKTVGQVFPDEKFDDSLLRCKIKSANLYKKTNTITLLLISNEKLDLISIYKFENFLKNRFNVKDARIIVEADIDFDINIEWIGIVRYLNIKHPMTKAILINSKPILQDKNLIVKLAVKGKDFLIGGGLKKN